MIHNSLIINNSYQMLIPKLRDLEIDFVLDVSALGVRNMAKMNKN